MQQPKRQLLAFISLPTLLFSAETMSIAVLVSVFVHSARKSRPLVLLPRLCSRASAQAKPRQLRQTRTVPGGAHSAEKGAVGGVFGR